MRPVSMKATGVADFVRVPPESPSRVHEAGPRWAVRPRYGIERQPERNGGMTSFYQFAGPVLLTAALASGCGYGSGANIYTGAASGTATGAGGTAIVTGAAGATGAGGIAGGETGAGGTA